MTAAIGALCVVATVGAWVLGPTVVRIAFGADFALGSRDLAVLAAASCIYLLALTLCQALIALREQPRVALGWGIGIFALAVVTLLGHDLLLRVELGFLIGAIAASVAMAVLLAGPMRRGLARSSATIPETGRDRTDSLRHQVRTETAGHGRGSRPSRESGDTCES